MDIKYGCLKTSPINIGEEIQEIAAKRFLPRIDDFIHREQTHKYRRADGSKIKLILNAWWLWKPRHFPPTEDIIPLPISMYIRKEIRGKFLTKKSRAFLSKNAPIGCRDLSTQQWLEENGIESYFSGCLTLTLQRNRQIAKQDYILCVDADKDVVEHIKRKTSRAVYNIPVDLSHYYTLEQRMQIANLYLNIFQSAHMVVSSRLHTILPCLALETPVLRVVSTKCERNIKERFSGYQDMVHSVKIEDLLEDRFEYDFEAPPKNPDKHLELRDSLIEKCKAFTQYDNSESLIIDEPYPILKLLELSASSACQLKRVLWHARKSYLVKRWFMKCFFGRSIHDIKEQGWRGDLRE